ncbi:MAG TPA: valine--tRNA ligase [Candidatus Woesebacteria bacterium]|nr:valine--tRNA ligase [Candidatus Woesebacteria bacterium]
MDKTYQPSSEENIYQLWENSGAFTPKIDQSKTPFTVILPPPNANEPLHAGHALFTVEDIMVRYHRMLGDPTLWLPGTDHAGIETQFVFEKHLKADGKSRFDYDRDTLFKLIADYVNTNRDIAKSQMKRLGFSLDWTRERFTLDPEHNARVFAVFKKMSQDGLIYRDEKIVNYCTFCGTAFSNLEVVHKTVDSHLWYLNYGPLEVATTRPETMLGDTAVAVNPADPRYQKLIGTKIKLPLTDREIPIIGEDSVDPKFGTGAVKVTPSHSPEDYDMAKKHGLEFIRIFDYDGHSNDNVPQKYRNLFPNQLRQAVLDDLQLAGLLTKIDNYSHEVGHCYKCGRPIEPITAPQWFVKVAPLAQKAAEVVKADQVKIFPTRFKKQFLTWMKDIRDWPISRQIVWGHRIPVWYNLTENPNILITYLDQDKNIITNYAKNLTEKYSEVAAGLQTLLAPIGAKYYFSKEEALKSSEFVLQETDTFDTWFSSGQWPYSTLGWDPNGNHSPDFNYFYPTSVLDTMWDILFFWVARMIMMGIYVTGEIPFKVAHMHSRVLDGKGQKMSKSKGNTINPVTIAQNYGADALRLALVIGVAPGSDIALSEDKIRAQRNFVNKIWNASRFVMMIIDKYPEAVLSGGDSDPFFSKLNSLIASTTKNLNTYRFGQASEDLYTFFWHEFCDVYIESIKDRGPEIVYPLVTILTTLLKLIHPFAPFVTESVYQELNTKLKLPPSMLITSPWPHEIR